MGATVTSREQSSSERAAQGREVRAEVPRSSHGRWEAPADSRDPVALLEEQARTRVPELVPIRYGRMLVSPFTFFRGSAYLMAADLAEELRTGLEVQLCGDAHLSNFGVFAAPDRRLVFSLNDFDETLPGPFEWDLKRLVASFAVAGRDRGFSADKRETINLTAARAYRRAMRDFSRMGTFELWYLRQDVSDIATRWMPHVSGKRAKRFERNVAKAQGKNSLRAFDKLTQIVDGEPRIVLCFCSSRKPRRQSSSDSSARASPRTTGSASWRASDWLRPQATSCSARSASPGSTASSGTITSVSCGTERARRSSTL